ncbi:ATP-binding protein [Ancylomarina sp.]|uniref:PAS domain-containing sensor histidine kinase n=1 Tax=Ancylomarina sp. TaxID=1970196 RepID=UPI0035683F7F
MTNKKDCIEFEKQKVEVYEGCEARFKQLLKNSFDMIVLIGANGVQSYVSESCEKILGYKPEELINISVIDKMIHPDDQGRAILALQNIIQNSANGGIQYRHRHKNGGWVYLEAFGTNQISNPAVKSIILNVRDITDRMNAKQALIESETSLRDLNATKDRFFSIIAHDLKSPFNGILGFSKLLEAEVHDKNYEAVEEYAHIIHNASQRAMNLLTNLLVWSRSQMGKIKYTPENCDLEVLFNEIAELLNDSAQQKSITISSEIENNSVVFVDKNMICTILRNLISNGIKFTKSGGTITICAHPKVDEWLITVSDNGVGISNEAIDKLFLMEYSYSTLGTQKEVGTGLGLLLCKEFVSMHGGRIWVESEVGKGSTFYFSIPIVKN